MSLAGAFRALQANAADAAEEFAADRPQREGIPLGTWRRLPDSETAARVVPEDAPAQWTTDGYTTTDAQGIEVHVPPGARVEAGNWYLDHDPEHWRPVT